MNFQIKSDYQPKGDQPEAIKKLAEEIELAISAPKFDTIC